MVAICHKAGLSHLYRKNWKNFRFHTLITEWNRKHKNFKGRYFLEYLVHLLNSSFLRSKNCNLTTFQKRKFRNYDQILSKSEAKFPKMPKWMKSNIQGRRFSNHFFFTSTIPLPYYHRWCTFKSKAQWSDRVTKPLRSFSNIETFLDFLNAFGFRKIIYPC